MLALTTTALEVVRAITADESTPEEAGLRIAMPGDSGAEPALQISVEAGPTEDDQVLSGEGATIFVDPAAAEFLSDKVLDAQVDEEGNAMFTIAEQPDQDDGQQPDDEVSSS